MWPRIDGLRTLDLGNPGELRDRLNALVLSGAKRATTGLLESDYRAEGEDPESVGERLVLIGSEGEPIAQVAVESVEIVPFRSVTWHFARAEGEGCTSLPEQTGSCDRRTVRAGVHLAASSWRCRASWQPHGSRASTVRARTARVPPRAGRYFGSNRSHRLP